VRALARLGESS